MRLPEEQIKKAIIHPEQEVRLTALRYFTESHLDDASVMPFVIQAVEQHGLHTSFELLRQAENLSQTTATVDWLIAQLRRDFNSQDMDEDNLRFALALILCRAQPEMLAPRYGEILALPAFPEPLKGPLGECLRFDFCDWPQLWSMFEELGKKTLGKEEPTRGDNQRFHRLLRAMARHPAADADRVLALLQGDYTGHDQNLMDWLEPWIVELAGRMRIKEAVPLLLLRLDEEQEDVVDEIGTALVMIGGDAVIDVVAKIWRHTGADDRFTLVQPLEYIHSDLAIKHGLRLLHAESDPEVRIALGYAVLGHFATEAIRPVRELIPNAVDDDELEGDLWDLRNRLVATATILGEGFPQYEEWHEEAMATNYGFEKIKDRIDPFWLADAFTETEGQRSPRRIKADFKKTYQLKVTLKEIEPPIWRRLIVPDCTLDDLHEMIQIAMGWETYHLYCFKIGTQEFTHPDMDEGELNMDDACSILLSDVLTKAKQKFIYKYDFGDGWRHEIVVEKIDKPASNQKLPLCVMGSRACPPEDVGGPGGYDEYLAALADPDHERYEELFEWRGEFDAEAFDVDATNQELRKVFR